MSDNETGFSVERSGGGQGFNVIGTTAVDVSTFIDDSIATGVDYDYRVRAFNDAGVSDYTNVVSHYINAVPTITAINGVLMDMNQSSDPIVFSVDDADSLASDLIVSVDSSNLSLLDGSGVALAGTGSERSLVLSPKPNAFGTATITVSVTDGVASASTSFGLTVDGFVMPEVSLQISSAADAIRSNEPFELSVDVSDPSLVERVTYVIDGVEVGQSSVAPFVVQAMLVETGVYDLNVLVQLFDQSNPIVINESILVEAAPTNSIFVEELTDLGIGQTSINGSVSYDPVSDVFTMKDTNGLIRWDYDTNLYSYVLMKGDFSISGRVFDFATASTESVAGFMLRADLRPESKYATVLYKGNGKVISRTRYVDAAVYKYEMLADAVDQQAYLRIDKTRSLVTYYGSVDGIEWTQLATATLDLGEECYVGMTLAAGAGNIEATAHFDGMSVEGTIVELKKIALLPTAPVGLNLTPIDESL